MIHLTNTKESKILPNPRDISLRDIQQQGELQARKENQKKARFFEMPQLFPTNPSATMVIRHVTPDIVTMSLPFARFGHLQFGGRGTLGK